MAKITRKAVDRAAADYQTQMQLYGPASLSTSRALGKWQEATAAYEKQTGRPLYRMKNPGGRGGRTLLASQVEAIEYRHGWDGLPYRHDFEAAGTRAYLKRDGSVEIENQDGKQLWDFYRDQPFLINHPKRARAMARKRKASKKANRPAARRRRSTSGAKKRRPPAGFRSWKEYMASIRPGGSRRKARRSNPQQGGELATRKSNPRKRRRSSSRGRVRRYSSRRRRNPPGLSVKGITGQVMDGAMSGLAITAGKVAARAVPAAVGLPAAGFAGIATQLGIGIAAGMLTDRMVSRRYGPYVMGGAFASVYESLLKKANLPVISATLGDEYDLLAAYPLSMPGLSAYPQGNLAAYPQAQLADSYVEDN